jgi:MFS family permease
MDSKGRLWLIYLGGFLLALHFASVSYVNSSMLKQFVGNSTLDILYIVGSILGIAFLFLAPLLLRRYGSVPTFLLFIAMETLAVLGMGFFGAATLIILLFIVHLSADSVLYFCLDISLEQETKDEGTTGNKRGTLLTFSNIAWVISPLALALLVTQNSFGKVYLLSGIVLIPVFLVVSIFFKSTKDVKASDSNIIMAIRSLRNHGDETRIIITQFILNFFYSWMIIYMPLLLSKEIGFSWTSIGVMFTIMLLPFVLFEFPAGVLGDKKFGEKEILITGFVIMFLATLIVPSLNSPVFWIWAAVLFATRIGASLVEVSSETYFFKHVREEDVGLISLFRIARPLAYVVAPLIAIPVMFFFSYSTSFYFLAFFVLLGLFFIPKIDTK